MPPPEGEKLDGRELIPRVMVLFHIIALNAYLAVYVSSIYMSDASIFIVFSVFFNIIALAELPLETKSIGAMIATIIAWAVFYIALPISYNLLVSAIDFISQHPLVAITYLGLSAVAWFAYERLITTIKND